MSTESQIQPNQKRPSVAAGILTRFMTVMVFLVLQAVVLFLGAGRITWVWPWVYLGISLITILVNGVIMLRTSPETVAERGRPQKTQGWDKIIGGLWGLVLYLAVPAVAGLDERFGWTRGFSTAWHIVGAVWLVAAGGLSGWAMIANAYFSTAVRIQDDRGQTVCRTGPYRFVRHPGYVGFIFQSLSVPVLFGSVWALLPGITAAALMVIRTSLEDRFLQAELAGYQDYAQKVRYRLIPGIW